MRTIKIMPDYECFPLWEASPGEFGNIDPRALPISPSLQEDLYKWAQAFDATLDDDDPRVSGFRTIAQRDEFKQVGSNLGRRLRDELGPNYAVVERFDAATVRGDP